MRDDDVKFRYKPQDGFVLYPGVPARDLTERDWQRLTPLQQREVKALPKMFVPADPPKATKTETEKKGGDS